MLIPVRAHVPTDRKPWANCAILLATVVLSFAAFRDPDFACTMAGFEPVRPKWSEDVDEEELRILLLFQRPEFRQTLPAPVAAVTSTFVHAGWLHLLGNMLFLWVFGNAVNYKFGHVKYLLLYAAAALAGGMAHYQLTGNPAIGASGAINGVVGAFVVFFPRNDVTVVWTVFLVHWRKSYISSVWIILFWLAWDVTMLFLGAGGVAYWSHLGGFATGFAIALLLAATGWAKPQEDEQTLLQVFGISREVHEGREARPRGEEKTG